MFVYFVSTFSFIEQHRIDETLAGLCKELCEREGEKE